MTLLSVDDSIFIFLSYGTLVIHIGSEMVARNHFCKACQNCLHPSFDFVHADAWIVALLWKLPQMPSCSTNNANLDKNTFDMFDKIDCCAAVHGRIWMNNVPNESRRIMLSCTAISFVISFFNFEKFWVKPRVSFFFFFTHSVLSVTHSQWSVLWLQKLRKDGWVLDNYIRESCSWAINKVNPCLISKC